MRHRKWYLKPSCFDKLFRYIFFLQQKSTLAYRNWNNLKRLSDVLRWTWTICFNICLILYKREKKICDYNLSRVIWLIFYSVLKYQLLTITNLNSILSGWPKKPHTNVSNSSFCYKEYDNEKTLPSLHLY